jgi:hypothetical protein
MWHAYGNANGYAYIHTDGDCDGNGHIHADSDCHGNSHADSDANGDIYGYGNRYGYSHSHSDGNLNRIPAAYPHATASSDTAAPTVRPAGCSLVWELASEPREFPLWPQSICSTRATVHRKVPRFHGSDWTWLRFRRRRQCNA